jgi:tripartite-type tricarboxylate transporter receptor subunit TctC
MSCFGCKFRKGSAFVMPRMMLAAAIVGLVLAMTPPAAAQKYPERIIKLVVPYLPGGGTDIVSRHFARELEKAIGQTVIVENRAGAGGLIGAQAVINSEPDGYTFLVGDNSTNSFVPALSKTPRYDPVVNLTPISLLIDVPNVLVVHPSLPAHSLAEMIAITKAKPGFYNTSTAGVGSFSHVAMELLNVVAGTQIVSVHYKGGAEALPAVLKGEVQIMISPTRNVLPYIQNGQLRALAVTSLRRTLFLPDVPTMAETIPGYSAENWYGLYAPAKLPESILTKVAEAVGQALDSSSMQDFARAGGTAIQKTTPAEFKALARKDYEKWAKVIDEARIPKN